MEEMQIVYMDVDELTPYEHNTRAHDREDIEAIKASIQRVGFRDPIGIWREHNIIVEGHGRLMAAKELGIKRLPCIRLDDMTDTQRRLYAIEHNRTAELSKWLPDELNREIEALKLEGVEMPELALEGITEELEDFEIMDDDSEGSSENGNEIETISFEFTDAQAEAVQEALRQIKQSANYRQYHNPENKNSNGNALFLISEEWAGVHRG